MIGRACGHNKQKYINQVLIYSHVKFVINYISLWEDNFDHSKVLGYTGNGVSATKNVTIMKASGIMMGSEAKRKAK